MRYSDSALRKLRTHFGLSQAELADYLGTDRSLLAHAEAGRRPLPLAATWRLVPLLSLLPPPSPAPTAPGPPDPAETTPTTQDALAWRLRVCRHEAAMLAFKLERQLPALLAARNRRALPTLLTALPPLAPMPGVLADTPGPDPQWAAQMAAGAAGDLARLGTPARALLEARRAGLLAEATHLEKALGLPPTE